MSNDIQPEIRFPGFTEDWEQRKLGEIVQITMGQSPNSENYTENPEDYILVQGNADMKNNRVVPRVWTTQITKQAEKGDLILSVRAPVGDIGKTDYDVVLGRGVAAIKGNDFIFQQLGKMKESGYWNRFSTGSTFESINSNDIREALITIPTGEEQQKIGNFFKQLDDTIALHQRKLDLLKETKKGFLQKMFPKNGAKVPEIRFPGFTENWEEKKFKEVINSGIKGKAKAEMSGTKSLYLDTNYLNGGVVTYVDSPRDVENDDVLILWDGSQAGTVYYGFSGALGSTLKAYRAKESGAFLYQQLKRNQQIIYDRYRTPNIPHVVKTFTDEFMVSMPSSEEQNKIGAFFKQLDDTIALHQRKLDLLKETKKGFLQKMFV